MAVLSAFRDREIAFNKNKFVKYIAHVRDVIKSEQEKEICRASNNTTTTTTTKHGKVTTKLRKKKKLNQRRVFVGSFYYFTSRRMGKGGNFGLARVTFSPSSQFE